MWADPRSDTYSCTTLGKYVILLRLRFLFWKMELPINVIHPSEL